MKSVHLIIADLFLPQDFAAKVCADLAVPALEKMLARGSHEVVEAVPLENLLCDLFGVPRGTDAPVAPISAAFDGLGAGCWLRIDPVHLSLQRNQLVLLPEIKVSADEAGQICAALNEHFSGQNLFFFAPHPQRWYLQLDGLPDVETVPMSQAAGRNVHGMLPRGNEARRWHQLTNEIQMLLFAHPVNAVRETRGELPINSVWLWGAGCNAGAVPPKLYGSASGDDALVEMCAAAAGIPFAGWPEQWQSGFGGRQLLAWTGLRQALQRGDPGAWREALRQFETGYAQPLWHALRSGRISRLQLDILGESGTWRVMLRRADTWAIWRRSRRLDEYSRQDAS